MARLERATLCTQNRCATRLRYIPKRKPRNTRFSAVTGIHAKWGERRDLNSRPSGPQPDALPTELLPPYKRGTYGTFSCLASLFCKTAEIFSSCPKGCLPSPARYCPAKRLFSFPEYGFFAWFWLFIAVYWFSFLQGGVSSRGPGVPRYEKLSHIKDVYGQTTY